jgi:hypothetical protein
VFRPEVPSARLFSEPPRCDVPRSPAVGDTPGTVRGGQLALVASLDRSSDGEVRDPLGVKPVIHDGWPRVAMDRRLLGAELITAFERSADDDPGVILLVQRSDGWLGEIAIASPIVRRILDTPPTHLVAHLSTAMPPPDLIHVMPPDMIHLNLARGTAFTPRSLRVEALARLVSPADGEGSWIERRVDETWDHEVRAALREVLGPPGPELPVPDTLLLRELGGASIDEVVTVLCAARHAGLEVAIARH